MRYAVTLLTSQVHNDGPVVRSCTCARINILADAAADSTAFTQIYKLWKWRKGMKTR